MMMIKRYRSDVLRQIQKEALKNRGGDFQVSILEKARRSSGADFVAWLEGEMRRCASVDIITEGDMDPPLPNEPKMYTAAQFRDMTDDAVRYMWQEWMDLPPSVTCSPSVWAYIVTRLILTEKLRPYYLMIAASGSKSDGRNEIDDILKAPVGDKRNKDIDDGIRSFFRRLSGVLERGTRSLYKDCPPARVWWQRHVARQTASSIGQDESVVMNLLRIRPVWEKLSDKMASHLTVVGDINLRDGILAFLLDSDYGGVFHKKESLENLLREVGIMSAWRGLGYFPPMKIKEIIVKDIVPRISVQSPDKSNQEE